MSAGPVSISASVAPEGIARLSAPAVAVPPAAPASDVVVAVWFPVAESESASSPRERRVVLDGGEVPSAGNVDGDRRSDADALARDLLGQCRSGAAGRGLGAERQVRPVEIDIRAGLDEGTGH